MKIPGSDVAAAIGQTLLDSVAGGLAVGNAAVGKTATPAPAPTPATLPKIEDFIPVLRGAADGAKSALEGFGFVMSAAPAAAGGATATASPAAATYKGMPILGKFQEARADAKYEAMNGGDKQTFEWIRDRAKSPDEVAYIKKALAAGHSLEEVEKFADQIRGKTPQWLHDNLLPSSDVDGGPGLAQQWSCSCAPTTAEVVRGEMDPIYTLNVRGTNTDITQPDPEPIVYDPRDPKGSVVDPYTKVQNGDKRGNYRVGREQEKILEGNGGKAVERGTKGGEGMPTDDALNSMSEWTGVKYEGHNVTPSAARGEENWHHGRHDEREDGKLKDAFSKLDADLANGIPGALRISNADNDGGHAVAITGVIDKPVKTYLIHDPWAGKTVYVKASDLEKGNVVPPVAGWDEVRAVYTSEKPD